ncbi:uncharacterized protein LOC102712171 isoform X2 [Oryza brachyantha]|uniref:uncharacterized protein LOC102712171 isoform X2 n=1 Tax=Oryza brachyantha TaxID=4533 RepID=UPI001ADABBE5|nr:uncharacterized protein LOC102712171 isoform X2 [Oryza brachyantha]
MKMESSSCRICHPVVVFQHCWDTTVLCGNVLTGIGIYICQYPDLIIYYIKIGINYGFSETCELCYGSSNILKLWSYQNCSKMVLPGGLIPLCSQVMDDSIFIVITIPIGGMGLLNVKDQSSLCLLFGLTLPSFSLALEEGGAGVQGVGAGGGGREGEAPYQDPPPLALGPCHLPLLPLHALSHQVLYSVNCYA